MAVTWNVNVVELGRGSGNYSVSAIVHDDTKPVGYQDENVSVSSGKLDTPEHKKQVWDELYRQYQEKTSTANICASLAADAKNDLEK